MACSTLARKASTLVKKTYVISEKTNCSEKKRGGHCLPSLFKMILILSLYTVKAASGASMMELSPSLITLRIVPTTGRMLWQKNLADATLPA